MIEESTYNGWTNRETWLVGLWLGNEPFTDKHSRDIANEKTELYKRADTLKDFVYDLCMGEEREVNGQSASMAVDLLNDAIETVNFREIVENRIEEDYSPPWQG